MDRVLALGVYLADRPNTAAHLIYELSRSVDYEVEQRWIALAPRGHGRFDLPATYFVVTEPTPKFVLLQRLIDDSGDFDWLLLCDDDVEVGPGFLDRFIGLSARYDFAMSQPARTSDSYTDHAISGAMPGLAARHTRFVEIGPVVCMRRDAAHLLLPFDKHCGMGWGLDFIWPARVERAGLRMGIIDATPVAHRIRRPVSTYNHRQAEEAMFSLLAACPHLTIDEAFTVVEAYP